jgi:osmotically-inducible protein OsmY
MKSDLELQQDVMAELQWEPALQAAHVGVKVHNSVVTLSGVVGSYQEKHRAEGVALRVGGVKALAVELKVQLPEFCRRTDADIARSAANILSWTSSLPSEAVHVAVQDGWLTLGGEVAWQYQRQDAADALRDLIGVTGVSNQIAIRPTASAGAVKADIETALRRRATADANSITVAVDHGAVTLGGTVHTGAERELAKRAAWSSPGVHQVLDHMNLLF